MSSSVDNPEVEAARARMPFTDHLRELRRRVFFGVVVVFVLAIVAFAFREYLFHWITSPLKDQGEHEMVVLGLVEMFVTYLKLSVIAGIFASMPWVLLQLWLFVAPGLYSHERRWVVPFVVFGTLFFIAGGAFGFYVVLPLGFNYLIGMVPEDIEATYRVTDYVALVLRLLLAFGLVFELPLVMWIMAAAGIVSPKTFSRLRPFWLVGAVIIGAILTPPDPVTQLLMAVPLVLFYELGVLGARLLYKQPGEAT